MILSVKDGWRIEHIPNILATDITVCEPTPYTQSHSEFQTFVSNKLWQYTVNVYRKFWNLQLLKVSHTFSLWKGSADWANKSSTTAKWPPAHAKESGVWSLLVVCLLTSARFEMRNCTVHRWPARQAFINGVRPPSDSCSC